MGRKKHERPAWEKRGLAILNEHKSSWDVRHAFLKDMLRVRNGELAEKSALSNLRRHVALEDQKVAAFFQNPPNWLWNALTRVDEEEQGVEFAQHLRGYILDQARKVFNGQLDRDSVKSGAIRKIKNEFSRRAALEADEDVGFNLDIGGALDENKSGPAL